MRQRWLLAGGALLLVALLTLALQRLAQRTIVAPFLRAFWAVYLVFRAIPPSILWALFLTGAFVLAMRTLAVERKRQRGDKKPEDGVYVRQEVRWLDIATRERYGSWRLEQQLSRLLLEALAYREGASTYEVEQRLRSGDLLVPPAVLAYLKGRSDHAVPRWRRTCETLLCRWRRGRRAATLSLETRLEPVVAYLETLLEVPDDRARG